MKIVECVPNFSEGRDMGTIKQITDAIESVAGARLLDVDPGADTNRTVVTFVGEPDVVVEAAFRAIKRASELIDMRHHQGAHPRMGATDVCPFVPVEGVTMEDCAELARRLGQRVGDELGIPVYLYEHAASSPERRNLAVVRRGEYEGLRERFEHGTLLPDFGPHAFNAGAGATAISAREFLVAYNVSLNTRDPKLATDIAFELREKGRVARKPNPSSNYLKGEMMRYAEGSYPCGNCEQVFATYDEVAAHCQEVHHYDLAELLSANNVSLDAMVGRAVYRAGLFKNCKAIGWYVDEYQRAQISINLTDYHVTPPHVVLEACRRLAAERGLVVTGSEIVGVVPFACLEESGRWYLERQGKTPGVPATDVITCAVQSMGLDDVSHFDVAEKVLGLPTFDAPLVSMRINEFADEVSRDTPAPGGGSIAALAGSLGASLASMVAALTQGGANHEQMVGITTAAQPLKDDLLRAIDADTDAFNAYMDARRLPDGTDAEKAAREAAMQDGLKVAVEVPLETARQSLEAMRLAHEVTQHGKKASITDGAVGVQMGFAGVRGGVWNVLINLVSITDKAFVEQMRARCDELLAEARRISDENTALVDGHLAGKLDA